MNRKNRVIRENLKSLYSKELKELENEKENRNIPFFVDSYKKNFKADFSNFKNEVKEYEKRKEYLEKNLKK